MSTSSEIFNPSVFYERSISEKLIENIAILKKYIQYVNEALSNDIFGKIYIDLKNIIDFININMLNSSKGYLEEVYKQKLVESPNLLEVAISSLLELMMYLHRAIRHRSPLFDRRIKFYETHYAFEPMYKALLASDAILRDCVERSFGRDKLLLLSFFGEGSASTPLGVFLDLEYAVKFLSEINPIIYSEYVKSLYCNQLKYLNFVSLARHAHLHSRLLMTNIHEASHNILGLLLYTVYGKTTIFYEKIYYYSRELVNLLKNYLPYTYYPINHNNHIEEILADTLATVLLGPAYPIAFYGSYPFQNTCLRNHPPELIRVYLSVILLKNMFFKEDKMLSNALKKLEDFLNKQIEKSNEYIKRYHKVAKQDVFVKYLSTIASFLIEEPYNEEDLNKSYELSQYLENNHNFKQLEEKMFHQEFSPIQLISAIWLKRIKEPRLNVKKEKFKIYVFRHTLHILNALKAWLEGFTIIQ